MFRTFEVISSETVKGAAINQLVQNSVGCDEFGQLVMTGAFVDGDTFAFFTGSWTGRADYESNTDVTAYGGTKYVVKLCASTALTLGDATLNNTKTGLFRNVTVTAHGMVVGNVFMVGTEAFYVVAVGDVNHLDVVRGYAGTTVAAHASSAAVLAPANYTNIVLQTDVILPVTALALATSGAQVATAMNALDGFQGKYSGSLAQGVVEFASGKKRHFLWEYISGSTRFVFHREARSGASGSTTIGLVDTVTNGTISASLTLGVEKGEVKRSVVTRVPTAAEVTAGIMDFFFAKPIKAWHLSGFVTSTGAIQAEGATVSFSTDFRRMTLTNNSTRKS